MSWNAGLPVLILLTSLVPGIIIFLLAEESQRLRSSLNLAAALLKLLLVGLMVLGSYQGEVFETRFAVVPGLDFVLRSDSLAILFAVLSSLLWLFTTIYAIGYLHGTPNQSRFFGFFSHCVTATLGIALAGNLFTFLVFYELLTLSTYPLVVHKGSEEALRAGRKYLVYTLGGGAAILLGTAWLHGLYGDLQFSSGGHFAALAGEPEPALLLIFALLVGGLGVKAAMVPLHGWLPSAMVAPAPVSALLHAVAVVKAGAFGIVRVVYEIYGIEFAAAQGLLLPLAWAACLTILYGSLRALFQQGLKRRLAYSTVSQVSYIVLGTALFGPLGTVGGVVHLVHQGLMKVTLFFCAGNYDHALGIQRIDQLDGAGARLPLTSLAFSVGALGMIGLPPLAGFVSKWYLGLGAVSADMPWVVAVLLLSSLLNAAYFLPLLHRMWFRPVPAGQPLRSGQEASLWLLLPPLATALLTLVAGLLAALPVSALYWAQVFAVQEYLQ